MWKFILTLSVVGWLLNGAAFLAAEGWSGWPHLLASLLWVLVACAAWDERYTRRAVDLLDD